MPTLPAAEKESVLEITDATLISASNSEATAQRILNYYQKRIEQEISFIFNNVACGETVDIEVYEDVYKKAVIKSMETDLVNGFITKAVVVGE